MKKLATLVLLLVVLAFYAFKKTSSHTEYPEITFPETVELHGLGIPLDTALYRYPYRFRVKGDRAIVEDLHGVDYFFWAKGRRPGRNADRRGWTLVGRILLGIGQYQIGIGALEIERRQKPNASDGKHKVG